MQRFPTTANDSSLVWQPNTEPDLAGYRIVWRETTAAQWQGAQYVGNVNEATVKLSKDNSFLACRRSTRTVTPAWRRTRCLYAERGTDK